MFSDGPERLFVFRVGAERFALPLGTVDEVIELPELQALPDCVGNVLGVAAIRGELVPIYDPRSVIRVGGDAPMVALLFSRPGRRVGLAIDDIEDAILVDEAELRSAPGTESEDGVLLGVFVRGPHLVSVLDAEPLLDAVLMAGAGEKT